MLKDVEAVLFRCRTTIWKDMLGGAALLILLVGGLYLPGLV